MWNAKIEEVVEKDQMTSGAIVPLVTQDPSARLLVSVTISPRKFESSQSDEFREHTQSS